MRKLTYKDTAYAPLNDLFNQAATEWEKGQYYDGRSGKAEGNEGKSLVARSIRCFTRCQALAKQVHESLVAPATRPEDLGLKPWFGPWGEWATRNGMSKDGQTPELP